MNRVALQSKDNAVERKLYMAMELSDRQWKVMFSDGGEKRRHETIEAGHRMELVEAIRKAKEKFDLSSEAKVVSCYRAPLSNTGLREGNFSHFICTKVHSLLAKWLLSLPQSTSNCTP